MNHEGSPNQAAGPVIKSCAPLLMEVDAIEDARNKHRDTGLPPAIVPEYRHLFLDSASSIGLTTHQMHRRIVGPDDMDVDVPEAMAVDSNGALSRVALLYIKHGPSNVSSGLACERCLSSNEIYGSLFQVAQLSMYTKKRRAVIRMPIPVVEGEPGDFNNVFPIGNHVGLHIPFSPDIRTDDYPGVGMYNLLLQEATVARPKDDMHQLTRASKLTVVFGANGYAPMRDVIYIKCGHGTLTRAGLAYHIAYNYQKHLTHDHFHESFIKDTTLPVVKTAKRMRLISLFTLADDPKLWFAEVAIIVDPRPD